MRCNTRNGVYLVKRYRCVFLQWFDCVNSRLGRHRWNDLKGGFGAAGEATLQRQKAILERAYTYALSMRAILKRDKHGKAVPKKALIPFQVHI